MNKFNESLSFNVISESMNEEKRTVKVCALAPCLSRNNRYYSPSVVESAAGTLKGKKCFADHDTRDTKNLIGKIVGESFEDGKLFADIRISRAKGIAGQTFEKIKDGTIDSVSIAANGKSKRVKMGEQYVDEVTDLKISSVDFVTEGGVVDAKVMHVYENVKDIPVTEEVDEMVIKNVEELKKEYPDLVTKVEEGAKSDLEALKKENKELRDKIIGAHKESSISKLEVSDKVKDILRGRVSGATEEEFDGNLTKELDFIKSLTDGAPKKEAKVEGVPLIKEDDKKVDPPSWTRESIVKDERIPVNMKEECANIMLYQGSKAMVEHLKNNSIEV